MALLADRVKETTTTTGTGTVSLAGAPAGFQSFNTAFANGSLVYYVIQGGAEWEIGIGTTGTGTLARTQVLQSSNADALVPFSAGVKDVFCSYVADRAVTTVDAATLTNKTIDDYTNNVGANSTHFRIKATGTISKGSAVKATGYNPGEMAIEVAVVTSATDLVLGISEQALTTGQFGTAVVIGELFDVNTNGFTVGNIIYSNGAGGFTETKPSSGLYQALGWIVRANTNNGVIAVNVVAPLYVETATNTANTSVLRDGSGNFAAGTITATLSGTATQVSQALTAGSYLTSTGTYNGGTARTFAVDATDANTASKVVARDASGNFAAGTITAALSGNATTATTADKVANALTAGTYITSTGTFDGSAARTFAVDATDANTANKVVARDGSGNFSAGTITATLNGAAPAGSLTGTTLASNVVASSITSVGTLSALKVISGGGVMTLASSEANATTKEAKYVVRHYNTAEEDFLVFYPYSTATLNDIYYGGGSSSQNAATGHYWLTAANNTTTSGSTRMSLDANGNFAVDTTTLYVDAANNRVGVGTASPATTLEVNGTTTIGQEVFRSSDTSYVRISGGNSAGTGANVICFGETHPTVPGQLSLSARGSGNMPLTVSTGVFQWFTGALSTEKMRLDASGNLGLGVTPSAWALSGAAAMQIKNAAFFGYVNSAYMSANEYLNASGNGVYIASATASRYEQTSGKHMWFTAPSGTAGNAITFTQAMTLDASSRLALNGTDPTVGGGQMVVNHGANNGLVINATASSSGAALYLRNNVDSTINSINFTNAGVRFYDIGTATERARIDASGNLGVGAASPTFGAGSGVEIERAGIATLRLQNTSDANAFEIQTDSAANGVLLRGYNASPLAFYTNNTERARITSGGVWLVNSTTNIGSETALLKQTGGAGSPVIRTWNSETSGTNEFIEFATETSYTSRGSITYNRGSGVVAYNTTSDYRAKDVFGAWQDAGQTIDALTVYRGKMKGATIERPMLIAHEAQAVAPYCVTGEKDAVDADGNPIYQQMDHSVLVPLLIAEVQSLRARIAALEA